MSFSLIVTIDQFTPSDTINSILEWHRKTIKPAEIICACWGRRDDQIDATVVGYPVEDDERPYNLSILRNSAFWLAKSDDLMFCDLDIVFNGPLGFSLSNCNSISGCSRRDVFEIGPRGGPIALIQTGVFYKCSASPFIISRKHFEMIGGYCMEYNNYGHEDLDIRLKIAGREENFKANHLIPIHQAFKTFNWDRGKDTNAGLYGRRRQISPGKLCAMDKVPLLDLKNKF